MRWSCVSLVLGFAGIASMTAPAQAVPFTLGIYADGTLLETVDNSDLGCTDSGTSTSCSATDLAYSNGSYTALRINSIQLDLDSDPIVSGNIALSNEQGFTQRFTLVFNLPIAAIPGATIQSGSISGSVADGFEGDGATISAPPGEAIYQARIDGVDTNALYASPSSFSAAAFDVGAIPATSFGPLLGGPALSSIALELDFFLTSFDSVQITSEHQVEPVPEPASGALIGFGLALLAARRRNRN